MSLKILDLHKSFAGKPVIAGLNLTLPDRGVFGLSGPSGCGKTTLLLLLAGILKPDTGTIEGLSDKVSMVFQEDRLLPWLTVGENITLILPDRQAALAWLERVRLKDWADRYPAELSGGMKRRVALARALARPSDLLLLDEPFNGMDQDLKSAMFELIKATAVDRAVVLVTHDQADLEQLAQNIVLVGGPPLVLLSQMSIDK